MVVIGIDFGEKKIGLAVGNTETMTSSPISIVKKAKTGFNWNELKEKIMEWEPNRIIIGKPLNMDGTRSDFMEKVERQSKKKGKPYTIIQNRRRHQYSISECGMYCLYIIIELLKRQDFRTMIKTRIKDKDIKRLRKDYFY